VDVASTLAANSGRRAAWLASPKLSLVFGPWARSEFFFNTGLGFHSNDARGITATVAARSGAPVGAAVPLVRTRGHELGLRGEWLPGLQSSVVLWQLDLASELVFLGDAGETAASGASRRRGVEFNHHYVANRWLALDADIAFSRARFRQAQGEAPNEGRHVPGAVQTVVSLGATVSSHGPWSGQLQLRHFGPRPLVEDNSVRSQGSTLANLRVGYRVDRDTRLALDIFNLFDRRASDIDYFYTSRLPGEPAQGVAGLHSHPAQPRTVRVGITRNF
jgi:outer membrane receptor protein involved in Fe transport